MRTERPAPWGFDVWDPRLTLRQQAADAQRVRAVEPDDNLDLPVDDEFEADSPRELEPVGAFTDR